MEDWQKGIDELLAFFEDIKRQQLLLLEMEKKQKNKKSFKRI